LREENGTQAANRLWQQRDAARGRIILSDSLIHHHLIIFGDAGGRPQAQQQRASRQCATAKKKSVPNLSIYLTSVAPLMLVLGPGCTPDIIFAIHSNGDDDFMITHKHKYIKTKTAKK
jgi:hypothetical protein